VKQVQAAAFFLSFKSTISWWPSHHSKPRSGITNALRHWLAARDWRGPPSCIDFVEADTPAAGGVGEKESFLSGSKVVAAKWRGKTICRLAATNLCLAKRNKSRTGAKAT